MLHHMCHFIKIIIFMIINNTYKMNEIELSMSPHYFLIFLDRIRINIEILLQNS